MKMTSMIIVLFALVGCSTAQRSCHLRSQASYEVTTKVVSTKQLEYLVSFTIDQILADGKVNELWKPKILVLAGDKGTIEILDENDQNGVICSALVKEEAHGLEAFTTVVVKENGIETLNSTQESRYISEVQKGF
jgi:hypothetical protein